MRTRWFASALCLAALAGWLAATVALWPGYREMNSSTGVFATLADAVLRGQAPAHEDGESFMATYYFPPFPLAVAAAHRAGLSWKDALRATSVVTGILLLAAAVTLALALGGGADAALLAVALLLASYFFKSATSGGRADLLAAACALGALASWVRDPGARGWRTPALAAASALVKATSISLPLALVAWALARREWGVLPRFGARFALCVAAGVTLTLPVHGPGWYLDAMRGLATGTPGTWNALRGPAEMIRFLGSYSEVAVASSFALIFLGSRGTRSAPPAVFFGASLAVAVFVMTNHGAGFNHLTELIALVAVCAGVWGARGLAAGSPLPAVALALVVLAGGWRDLLPLLRHARDEHNLRAGVTRVIRDEPGPVLSEDALLTLAAGRRPALTDPGALRSLALKGDPRAERVVQALERGEFRLVVLLEDLEWGERWYRDFHLGEPAASALRRRYRKVAEVDGFHLYRPGVP